MARETDDRTSDGRRDAPASPADPVEARSSTVANASANARRGTGGRHKLMLSPSLYIEVDDDGYLQGRLFEGAFGCVFAARAEDQAHGQFAVKIPRLLADTIRENGFITTIAEDEAHNYRSVAGAGPLAGLLPCSDGAGPPLLAGPLQLKHRLSDSHPCATQHDHVPFVSFEKGRPPRFALVKLDEDAPDKWSVFPEGVKATLLRFLSPRVWKTMAAPVGGRAPFTSPAYCMIDEPATSDQVKSQRVEAGEVKAALTPINWAKVWYSGLPAVTFPWAPKTLQDEINRGTFKDWDVLQLYRLFEAILTGLDNLHGLGKIHGDLRPANILARERTSDAAEFLDGDYGAFCNSGPRATRAGSDTGNTLAGPAVAAARISAFYAPERRAGIERESANVAVVLPSDRKVSLICLGNKKDLLVGDSEEVKPAVVQTLEKELQQMLRDAAGPALAERDAPRKGDRLRVRDYVFEVIITKAVRLDADLAVTLCLADSHYARVLHDRLAIVADAPLPPGKPLIITLASYLEYQQWSAATDLYSVGAICLYCLFTSELQAAGARGAGTPSRATSYDVSERVIDAQFAEMMRILESVPYFQGFWPELSAFHESVSAALGRVDGDGSIATRPYTELYVAATKAVNNLVQSAPHVRMILRRFEWNMARFLLFVRFALGCLHRRNHLDPAGAGTAPFCADRAEIPRPRGAAAEARKALAELSRWWDQPFIRAFVVPEGEVPHFDPRSEAQIRIDLESARKEIKRLADAMKTLDDELTRRKASTTEMLSGRLRQIEQAAVSFERSGLLSRKTALQELRRAINELRSNSASGQQDEMPEGEPENENA